MSIPSNLPPTGPIIPSNIGPVSENFTPVYFFESSIIQSVKPLGEAGVPQLSLAEFYGSLATAKVGQNLQDILNQLSDPLFRKKLMTFVAEQAAYMTDVLTLVYRYDMLNEQLSKLKFADKANQINQALQAYGGSTQDNIRISTLNSASTAYNTAQTTYQTELSTYETALTSYQTAENTYKAALVVWNQALSDYQSGSITQAQLEAARSTFNSAESQFQTAQNSFNTAQSNFDSAKTNWQTAVTTYTAAVNSYNSYVASRAAAFNAINTAINSWNSSFSQATTIIAKMNAILSALGLPSLTSTSLITPLVGLQTVSVPLGPSTLRNGVQSTLDQDNFLINSMNTLIGSIGSKVTTINAGGYTPALTTPSSLSLIASPLPTTDSNSQAALLSPISIPTSFTITPPSSIDLIAIYLVPRLPILDNLKNKTTLEEEFRTDTEPSKTTPLTAGRFAVHGGAGTSSIGLSNAVKISTSPFLAAILSQHAMEAIFNVYGVPAGSPLIDQLGAFYKQIQTTAGLLSASIASKILNHAALTETAGKNAVDAAIALGNLSVISSLGTSEELRSALSALIENEASLAELTLEQKNGLIDALMGEIGASLNRNALNEIARALGLPGLLPQVLAVAAGVTAHDPLASFSDQIYRYVLFEQELANAFQISNFDANNLIQNALSTTPKPTPDLTPEQQFDAVKDAIIDQMVQTGIAREEAEQKISEAKALVDTQLAAELQKTSLRKDEAFRNSLVKTLSILDIDPQEISTLVTKQPEEIKQLLLDKGFTLPEANQVVNQAVDARNAKDPDLNPLSSFLTTRFGNTTELAGLLKGQIVSILSPAVGMRNALEVAENYGNLIFSSANSITGILHVNERRLDAISYFIYDARLYELYRESTISYISPALADDNPLKLGKTLLLSGIAGGLYNQGLTSADNTLGPSAGQSKHATSYPGIFG